MSAGMVVAGFVLLLFGLAAVGLAFFALLEPEQYGRVSEGWLRRQRRDEGH